MIHNPSESPRRVSRKKVVAGTATLRQQLFVYRDLWKWIDEPFQAPETVPPQLELAFI